MGDWNAATGGKTRELTGESRESMKFSNRQKFNSHNWTTAANQRHIAEDELPNTGVDTSRSGTAAIDQNLFQRRKGRPLRLVVRDVENIIRHQRHIRCLPLY